MMQSMTTSDGMRIGCGREFSRTRILAGSGIDKLDKELARAEFVGYLLLSPLIPVGGWWWAKNDETRWGAGVLLVVGLVMPVLVIRIQQVWAGV